MSKADRCLRKALGSLKLHVEDLKDSADLEGQFTFISKEIDDLIKREKNPKSKIQNRAAEMELLMKMKIFYDMDREVKINMRVNEVTKNAKSIDDIIRNLENMMHGHAAGAFHTKGYYRNQIAGTFMATIADADPKVADLAFKKLRAMGAKFIDTEGKLKEKENISRGIYRATYGESLDDLFPNALDREAVILLSDARKNMNNFVLRQKRSAGMLVNKEDNFISSRRYEREKIAGMDKEEFSVKMIGLLSDEGLRPDLQDMDARILSLGKMYDNILDIAELTDFETHQKNILQIFRRVTKHRILKFKNADAEFEMMRSFSDPDFLVNFNRDIEINSLEITMHQLFGNRPDVTMAGIFNRLRRSEFGRSSEAVGKLQTWHSNSHSFIDFMRSPFIAPSTRLGKFFKLMKTLQPLKLLVTAITQAPADLIFGAAMRRADRGAIFGPIAGLEAFTDSFSSLFKRASRTQRIKMMKELNVGAEQYASTGMDSLFIRKETGLVGRKQKWAAQESAEVFVGGAMRWTGLNYVTQTMEASAALGATRTIKGMVQAWKADKMTPALKELVVIARLRDSELNILSKYLPTLSEESWLDLNKVNHIPWKAFADNYDSGIIQRRELAAKLGGFIDSRVRQGVPLATLRSGERWKKGSGQPTATDEFMDLVLTFKRTLLEATGIFVENWQRVVRTQGYMPAIGGGTVFAAGAYGFFLGYDFLVSAWLDEKPAIKHLEEGNTIEGIARVLNRISPVPIYTDTLYTVIKGYSLSNLVAGAGAAMANDFAAAVRKSVTEGITDKEATAAWRKFLIKHIVPLNVWWLKGPLRHTDVDIQESVIEGEPEERDRDKEFALP